jgi:hypothetical protein
VSSVQHRPRPKARRRRGPGRLGLRLRRLWSRMYAPLVRSLRARRIRRRGRGVRERPTWLRSRLLVRAARIVSYLGAALFVLWVIRAFVVLVRGRSQGIWPDLDAMCQKTTFSCDALAGTLLPVLTLAVASAVFLLVRLRRVRRPYVRKARERPGAVVQTAGSLIGEVVGRDELCRVMIADLRDPHTRRPHVVVGGVGTGKTALLVRLTNLLAERGAVPVPVRLRDAQQKLDFRELARQRFFDEAEDALLSDAEGEKVWRHLCKNNQVVVLADGLEEALIEGDAEKDRNNLIRLAVRKANDTRLPLVIASRPHDPLQEMEAAIIELEPLSEEAALQYLQRTDEPQEEHRLDWIVETAEVTEMPLYLQITRDLHRAELTEYVSPRRDGGQLDTRSVDRAELRLRLLDTWMKALVNRHFPSGLPLSSTEREAAIEQVSALACIGLKQDSLYVRFDDLEGRPPKDIATAGTEARERGGAASPSGASPAAPGSRRKPTVPPHPGINKEVERRLDKLKDHPDLRLAATWGAQLGLVEASGDGVRFPHSIMQAYLGSRLIDVAVADPHYLSEALEDPGREFLIALVIHSRAEVSKARLNGVPQARVGTAEPGVKNQPLRDVLVDAADGRYDVKALDLYAAALEIDSVDVAPEHGAIAGKVQDHWERISGRDERTYEEAKLNLVRRFGEAARKIVEQHQPEPDSSVRPAYPQLYDISASEKSYAVRLAAAQEIGAGADQAFDALDRAGLLGPPERAGDPPGGGEERRWREEVTRAWLAPLLVGSVTNRTADARRDLEQWLEFVREQNRRWGDAGLPTSLEVALAQGFKHAANRRRRHPHAHAEARTYLAEQATEMLRGAHFWFTRLTLVHALCLWSLPDPPAGQLSNRGGDADLKDLVEHWIAVPDGGPEHPFVLEARKLALWALETGRPEQFIWIDESGVLARVGSRPVRPGSRRKHNLWIPPSTGWTALHPHAQQLVADVLLLLNLAERGARPSDRERRLRRTNRSDLPPCLAGDRDPLDPGRTIGTATTSEPGSNCKHGCPFGFCPYPPKGEQSYRVELSEAFCRRQQALVGARRLRRKAAPWQATLPGDLKRFWKQMGQRAQPSELDGERDTKRGRGLARRAR